MIEFEKEKNRKLTEQLDQEITLHRADNNKNQAEIAELRERIRDLLQKQEEVTQQVDILNHTVEDFSKTSNLLEQEQVKSTELTAKLKKRRVQVEAMTRQIGELSVELETMKKHSIRFQKL